MLKNNVLLILMFLCGCSHKKDILPFVLPQAVSEPRITPVIVESPKPQTAGICTQTDEKVYCDGTTETEDVLTQEAGVQAFPSVRDEGTQTEVEQVESEYINDSEHAEPNQSSVPKQFNIDDISEVQSEYISDEEENELLDIEESILEGQEANGASQQNKTPIISPNSSLNKAQENNVRSLSGSWEILNE